MQMNRRRTIRLAFGIVVSLGAVALPLAAQESPEQESRDLELKRQEWFYGQRAYPHAHVPQRANLRAMGQLHQKVAAEAAAAQLAGKPRTSLAWNPIGPKPIHTPYSFSIVSGRVTALAIDPANANHVYLGGAQGGVWETTDGGTNWTSLTDNQPTLAVGSLALDPSDSNIVYVGTGEGNFSGDSYYGEGILKSTDGGATWTQYCGPFCGPLNGDGYYGGGARISGVAVQPSNGQVLLASTELIDSNNGFHGVYRSADGGVTWTEVITGVLGTAVLFDPSDPNTAYAAIGDGFSAGQVYKSTDGGQTWSNDSGSGAHALPKSNAGRIVLAMSPAQTKTLYAGIANGTTGALLGIYKTTDGGTSWAKLANVPDYCTPQCWYDNVIAVDPANENIVFAGGAGSIQLVRSTDGGTSWANVSGILHPDTHALAFSADGATLYIGNDGGGYSTTQITATRPAFTALNSTLALTQFYPGLSILPSDPTVAIGGTQDNGTDKYSGNATWNEVTCGDGGYTAIDFASPNIFYATCEDIYILKSTNSGANWAPVLSGIDTQDRVDFIPPLVMDPSNSKALYFATYRVYQTTNGASHWTAISPDLTTGNNNLYDVITTIAVAPTDPNTVYAGTGDSQVQVSTNAGSGTSATWTNRSTGLPARVITQVAVDPTVSTTAYVTFSGFTGFGDNQGNVFRTTDGGHTWADISSDLPNTPVNCIVVYPSSPTTLFVGTDVGVFYTTNSGGAWTSLVDGLPAIAVLGLTVHAPSNTLRASTHGRGVWDLDVSSLVAAPAVALSAASLTFDKEVVGMVSKSQPVRLTNTGTASLVIANLTTSGDFTQKGDCGTSLAAGAECTMNVVFKPSAKGPRTGQLTLTDNAPGNPQTVSLSGIGTVVQLLPEVVNFGSLPVGQKSPPQTVTLSNKGKGDLTIMDIRIGGASSGDYQLTNSCGAKLASGGHCTLSVTFTPSAQGARNADIRVRTDGGGNPRLVILQGSGS